MIWMDHSWFIHSFTGGHLHYFQFGAISNKAAKNIFRQAFVWTQVSILWAAARSHECLLWGNPFGPALSHFNEHTNHPKRWLSADSNSMGWGLGFCIPNSSQAMRSCWCVGHPEQATLNSEVLASRQTGYAPGCPFSGASEVGTGSFHQVLWSMKPSQINLPLIWKVLGRACIWHFYGTPEPCRHLDLRPLPSLTCGQKKQPPGAPPFLVQGAGQHFLCAVEPHQRPLKHRQLQLEGLAKRKSRESSRGKGGAHRTSNKEPQKHLPLCPWEMDQIQPKRAMCARTAQVERMWGFPGFPWPPGRWRNHQG